MKAKYQSKEPFKILNLLFEQLLFLTHNINRLVSVDNILERIVSENTLPIDDDIIWRVLTGTVEYIL